MTNFEKIKKMLELGGKAKAILMKKEYNPIGILYEFIAIDGNYIYSIDGDIYEKDTFDWKELIEVKFLPNPPKMYKVGEKVKYNGKIYTVKVPSFYGNKYYYQLSKDMTTFIEAHHFDLEPVFEDNLNEKEEWIHSSRS